MIYIGKKSLAKISLFLILFLIIAIIPTLIKSDISGPQLKVENSMIEGNFWSKKVVVYNNENKHYYNVSVSTDIPENLIDVELYLYITSDLKMEVTNNPVYSFQIIDSDGNGLNDTAKWIVPELSEVGFSVEGKLSNIPSDYQKIFNLNEPVIKVASSWNPSNTNPVGIEFNSTPNVWHLWNENDDYYINSTSGVQITNHYQQYWTKNKWCVYVQLGSWRKVCADAFSWAWYSSSDNQTYANLTGTTSGSYPGGYKINIIYEYYLMSKDTSIRITPTVINTGNAFSGYLIWRIQDIQIDMTQEYDVITYPEFYWLNETLNLNYTNVEGRYFNLKDNNAGAYLKL
jgi:hypothetical protein